MMARQKSLEVVSSKKISTKTLDKNFSKPDEKSEVKLFKPEELDKLIDHLKNEAKVL